MTRLGVALRHAAFHENERDPVIWTCASSSYLGVSSVAGPAKSRRPVQSCRLFVCSTTSLKAAAIQKTSWGAQGLRPPIRSRGQWPS